MAPPPLLGGVVGGVVGPESGLAKFTTNIDAPACGLSKHPLPQVRILGNSYLTY